MLPQQQAQALHLGVQPVVLVEHGGELGGEGRAALLTAGGVGTAEHVQERLDDPGPVGAEPAKDLGCEPFTLADQAKQEVFGAHIVVTKPFGFTVGQFQHFLGSGSERWLPGRRCGTAADDLFDLRPGLGRAHAKAGEDLGRDTVAGLEQAEQQMLGTNVIVAKTQCLASARVTAW